MKLLLIKYRFASRWVVYFTPTPTGWDYTLRHNGEQVEEGQAVLEPTRQLAELIINGYNENL